MIDFRGMKWGGRAGLSVFLEYETEALRRCCASNLAQGVRSDASWRHITLARKRRR